MSHQQELGLAKPQTNDGPVECLGMTFESDHARRAYFLGLLAEKLKDPKFRSAPGFPNGSDEDILRLSDPPYYTACPSPFLTDALSTRADRDGGDTAHPVQPFAADVSEGKGERFYNVHTYHTKVPYKAISRFLLHYTRPGDVVLDSFCGTGMLGLAAQACASPAFVRELAPETPDSLVGARTTILQDLSPAASHIAANYNHHVNELAFEKEAESILAEFRDHLGWMFATTDPDSGDPCPVDYFVWSDVFACPECGHEVLFWSAGVDQDTGYKKESKEIRCPSCSASNHRDSYERVVHSFYDDLLGATASRQKEQLVLITYQHSGRRKQKAPDQADHDLVATIDAESILTPVPVRRMMDRDGAWGDMYRAGYHIGMTHFHHFYYRRSLRAVSWLWSRVERAPESLRMRLRWWLQSVGVGHTRLNRYFTSSYSQVNRYLKGFLYIAQVRSEVAPWYSLSGKVGRMATQPPGTANVLVSTGSATRVEIPSESVDYIFTDPPFGGNIIYSELNFMWEAWFGVVTAQVEEAIISKAQEKALRDYEALMVDSFVEYHRVLKAGRWITILFHNSHNAVWMAIQAALQRAGFVVADVRVFDKKQLTMKQQTAAGAVQKDLLITAYRPARGVAQAFETRAGTEAGVWEFVTGHLRQLPVVVSSDGSIEQLSERMQFLLFDRMVAFHVEQGISVPISAGDFYAGLAARYPMRDDMFFLNDQVAEYDRVRARCTAIAQLSLFVTDEATGIQWVRQQLSAKPQTFQELQPKFMREIQAWAKHEEALELATILEQNFLHYAGEGPVPAQVHSYLSSNFKELRRLEKDDPALMSKAQDRWYVPDPKKQADIEKLRERSLLRDFEVYVSSSKSELKVFRTEAVRAGFKSAWQARDYGTIVKVAEKLPADVLQEDATILMYYDNALTRLGDE